jgi:hypothetical protein
MGRPLVLQQLEVLAAWGATRVSLLAPRDDDLERLRSVVRKAPVACAVYGAADAPATLGEWLFERAVASDESILTMRGDLLADASWGEVTESGGGARPDLTVAAVGRPGDDGQWGEPVRLALRGDVVVPSGAGDELTAHLIGMSVVSPSAVGGLAATPGRVTPSMAGAIPWLTSFGYRIRLVSDRGSWRHLSTWRRVWAAHRDRLRGRVFVDRQATVAPSARVSGWAWVGPGAIVEPGADVSGSVISSGAVVGAGARLSNSFISEHARVNPGAKLAHRFQRRGGVPALFMPEEPQG